MLIRSYQDRLSRTNEKKQIILAYLRDEIWSNAQNMAQLLGITQTAIYKTLAMLEQSGLIKSHYISELRFRIWGITPMGLLYSWGDDEEMQDRAIFEPSKVKPVMVQHHLDLQIARFQAETSGWTNWVTGNLLPKGIAKRPDAVADSDSHSRVAVELERTIKTKKRYEVIFSIYLQAIKRGEYQAIHYVCPDPEFAERLRRMFKTINSVPVASQRIAINEKHRARFIVFSLANWPQIQKEIE